jgi:hypothetical protein
MLEDGDECLPDYEQQFADKVAEGVDSLHFDDDGARLKAIIAYLNHPDRQILVERKSMEDGYPGEYTVGAYHVMMEFFATHCGASAAEGSVLLDIGSGAGKPVFVAALCGHFARAMGIEINHNKNMCTWLALQFGVDNASFYRGDAGSWLPEGATHIYSFNKTFPQKELKRIAARLNEYPTWRYMVTSYPASVWSGEHGLEDVEDVATLTQLSMAGSGRQYAMYVIKRTTGASSDGAASSAAPSALASSAGAAADASGTLSSRDGRTRSSPGAARAGSGGSRVSLPSPPASLRRATRAGDALAAALAKDSAV